MTLTKEMFLNHLYGGREEPEMKIIDVFICKLRKKLAAATGGYNYIETIWGRGYILRDPEKVELQGRRRKITVRHESLGASSHRGDGRRWDGLSNISILSVGAGR